MIVGEIQNQLDSTRKNQGGIVDLGDDGADRRVGAL